MRKTTDPKIYIVGSVEGKLERFIADRVYLDPAAARGYCDNRAVVQNIPWVVYEADSGGDWLSWRMFHRGQRT